MHDKNGAILRTGDFVKVRRGQFGKLLGSSVAIVADGDPKSVMILFTHKNKVILLCCDPGALTRVDGAELNDEKRQDLLVGKETYNEIVEEVKRV